MKTEADLRQALRDWVLSKSKKVTAAELTDQTSLIETRIISSLQIMELILLIEKLRGQRFDLKSIKPGAFGSIDSIYDSFLKEVPRV